MLIILRIVILSLVIYSCSNISDKNDLKEEKVRCDTFIRKEILPMNFGSITKQSNLDSVDMIVYNNVRASRLKNIFVSDESQRVYINDKNFSNTYLPKKGDTLVTFTTKDIFLVKVTHVFKAEDDFDSPPPPNSYGFTYDSLYVLGQGKPVSNYPFEKKLFCKFKFADLNEIKNLDSLDVKELFTKIGEKQIPYFNEWETRWKSYCVNFSKGKSNYFYNGILCPIWVCKIGKKFLVVVQISNEEYSQLHYFELSKDLQIKLLYIPYMA